MTQLAGKKTTGKRRKGLSLDGKLWTGEYFEPVFGSYVGVITLTVHDPIMCEGRPCCLHQPSEHHLSGMELQWRADRGIMERRCEHGVGHPDPDDRAYNNSIGRDVGNSHGCDGCCFAAAAAALRKQDTSS